jgi:hypothetical protein
MPVVVYPTTASVRLQFARAKAEIEALQARVDALETEEPVMDAAPIPLVAGDGAASAVLDISAATGLRCVISATGPILVRFGPAPVTAAIFHLAVRAGETSQPFRVGDTVTELTAWGDGGAWPFNLVPAE